MHVQSLLAGALALAPSASAHFLFPHLMLNGVRTGAFEYVREHDFGFMPHNNDWINSPDFRCNEGSWRHRREPKTAVVTAGVDVVGFNLHLDFDLYHPGPVTIYLSRAPGDVRDYDGSGDWFKVYQLGTRQPFNGTDEGWATWKMKNWQFRLPAEIPAGEYLMRIEQMSVHPPYRQKEWYVQCAHLKINSNYNGPAPGPTIKIPGGYKISDPAIQYDQWAQPPPTYAPMPGPALWPNNNPQQGNPNQGGNNGGGNQGGGNGGCTVPKWGQCGGQGYSGCRNCESGSTCRAQNDWYSQCL